MIKLLCVLWVQPWQWRAGSHSSVMAYHMQEAAGIKHNICPLTDMGRCIWLFIEIGWCALLLLLKKLALLVELPVQAQ